MLARAFALLWPMDYDTLPRWAALMAVLLTSFLYQILQGPPPEVLAAQKKAGEKHARQLERALRASEKPEAERLFDFLWLDAYGVSVEKFVPADLWAQACKELHVRIHEDLADPEKVEKAEKARELAKRVKKLLKLDLGVKRPQRVQWTIAATYLRPVAVDWLASVALVLVAEALRSVFHQIGAWARPIEAAAGGDWGACRLGLVQLFAGHLVIDLCNFLGGTSAFRAEGTFGRALRGGVFAALLRQDFAFFDRHPTGVLEQRLHRDAALLGNYVLQYPRRIGARVTGILCNLAGAYLVCPPDLFLVAIAPLPIIVLGERRLSMWNRSQLEQKRKIAEAGASSTGETLREIKTVRQFTMEQDEAGKFGTSQLVAYHCELKAMAIVRAHSILWSFLVYGGLLVTLWLGAARVAAGEMSVGDLLDVMFKLNFNVVFPLQAVLEELPELMSVVEPLHRICTLLQAEPKIEGTVGLRPTRFAGAIEFCNVRFTYPTESRKEALRGMSFRIEPGEKVALVGESGCGKTSCMALLQRLYDPTGGTILLDGRPIAQYDLARLRSRVVIVDQHTVLFRASVRENVTYGCEASDEQIEAACKDARAWAFIQELPDGLETLVSERGASLAGGQRQRVAIARAMVRQPDVILLDEATSALDVKNERHVQEALDALSRRGSSLVIAHRLSTIRDADRIVVVENGRAVEVGTHSELLAKEAQHEEKLPISATFPAREPSFESTTAGSSSPKSGGSDLSPPALSRTLSAPCKSNSAEGGVYAELWANASRTRSTAAGLKEQAEQLEKQLYEVRARHFAMQARLRAFK